MLRLLLDEHISPRVADGLRGRNRLLEVSCLAEMGGGRILRTARLCLPATGSRAGVEVCYLRSRTIPPLPKAWAEEERKHGGVIFLDEKTISPSDTGSLVRALSNLLRKTAKWDWTNRVRFLRR